MDMDGSDHLISQTFLEPTYWPANCSISIIYNRFQNSERNFIWIDYVSKFFVPVAEKELSFLHMNQ
jgi:hypothetical protein